MRTMLIAAFIVLSGCAHTQLRRHTSNQIRTVTDLQHQQVLDNLAMFVANPEAMPFFSVPGSGGTSINTTGQATNSITWNLLGFASDTLFVGGSRSNGGSWTLAPINDPAKLQRMQCAYQLAVGFITSDSVNECVQCCQLLDRWYPDKNARCAMPCHVPPPGWYSAGCEKDVPADACLVGHHGDVWVWVDPSGAAELTRLTLTILDFATAAAGYSGPPSPTQQVVRKWKPLPDDGSGVTKFELLEVTTTTIEGRTVGGLPAQKQPLTAEAVPSPAADMFDRPRENFFNPILPNLELFRNQ